MPGDLSISQASSVQTALSARASSNSNTLTATGSLTASTSTTASTTGTTTSLFSKTPPPVNPGLYLDPATNLVVLQFFDSKGDVVQSTPSQKQLDAYKLDGGKPKDSSVSIS